MTIVVLNWRRPKTTLRCLAALERLDYPSYEVLVVDNDSGDDSVDTLLAARPDVNLLVSPSNGGYAGGNNFGITRALHLGSDYIWVINNDTLPETRSLRALVDAAEERSVGCLSSCIVDASGRPHATAALSRRRGFEPIVCSGCDAGFHPADALMGASLFVRARVVREVGGFDNRFFHYFEDRDFVERVRQSGQPIGLSCLSRVEHEEGASLSMRSPQSTYYFVRNQLLFETDFRRGRLPSAVLATRSSLRSHLAVRHALRFRDFRGVRASLYGVVDALRGRVGQRCLGRAFEAPLPWSPHEDAVEESIQGEA